MSKQRKPKPPTLPPRYWAPLKDAFAQVAVTVGPDNLAAHELTQDLREGLLVSVWRSLDGSTIRFVNPTEWQQWRVQPPYFMFNFGVYDGLPRDHGVSVTPVDENALPLVGHFFVRRRELDRRYPATTPSERRAGDKQPTPPLRTKPGPQTRTPTPGPTTSDRRKPGPKIKHNWKLHLAVELHRIKKDEGRTPTAKELAQFCRDKWDYEPDLSEIQKLMRYFE